MGKVRKSITEKQKQAHKKARELQRVKERALLFQMQALARGEKIEKTEKFLKIYLFAEKTWKNLKDKGETRLVFKKFFEGLQKSISESGEKTEKFSQKERFFSLLTGKRVSKEQYEKDLKIYADQRGVVLVFPSKKIQASEELARKTWKNLKDKGETKLTFKKFFEEFQKSISEKLVEYFQEFSIDSVSDVLAFTGEEWKIYANNEAFTLPELVWYLREVQHEIREFFVFFLGALINRVEKTVRMWFNVSDLKDASDNEQTVYEENFVFQKISFKNIKVVFSSK